MLPFHTEADKLQTIPTTSTTMSLALGDALCCSVLSLENLIKNHLVSFILEEKLEKN